MGRFTIIGRVALRASIATIVIGRKKGARIGLNGKNERGMKMLDCVMCITNEGILEKGKIDGSTWYTIDRITVKMASGKRFKRYAVCVNGRWKSEQQMSLHEARAEVQRLKDEAEQAQYYAMNI